MSTESRPLGSQIFPAISAGLVTGLVNVILCISLAALIFRGDIAPFTANAIGFILLGCTASVLITGFFSSYKGSISTSQDTPAAILAVMAAGIMESMGSSSPHDKFVSIVAAVAITSILTGIFFILLGQFKLGSLVRFLPYPVVGGFLAGTGWLLFTGGIGVMSPIPFSFTNFGALFQSDVLLHWAPGVIIGCILLWILNRSSHFLIVPGFLLGTAVLFYAIAFFAHIPTETLSAQGWLLGPFPNSSLLQPLSFADMAQIHWGSIFAQAGGIASILMISVVAFLLNGSGIELIVHQDLDLNRELRMLGFANILAGSMGGIVNYHALGNTAVNYRIGQGSRFTSWVTAMVCVLPLLFGASALSYVPKIALGVLLILLGLSLLYEWVYLSWFNFSRIEYVVIIMILIVIAVFGFLQGVGSGIGAAVILFVVSYSSVSVTRHALSGAELQSRFTRSLNQRKALIEQGQKTFILQLQGFIFFGTANKLLEQARGRVEDLKQTPLQFLILDFAKVSGLDSTALLSFSKMKQILQDRSITILVTGPSAEILKQLEKGGFVSKDSNTATAFPDLDHGLEWVENKILNTTSEQQEQNISLKDIFHQLLPDETHLNDLFGFLEKIVMNTGDYLMRQEDDPDHIYFVERGQVTAQLEYPNQAPVRLETMKSGRVIGELGFYLGQKRTAAVVADEPSTVYYLSAKNLTQMEKKSPQVASYFHQLIIQLMAERTTHLIRTVAALEK